MSQIAFGHVEIGPADPTQMNLQQHLPGAGPRGRDLLLDQRAGLDRASFVQAPGTHQRGLFQLARSFPGTFGKENGPRHLERPVAAQLTLKEKIGYALGDTASNFYWKTFEFFLLIFYTDVFGLSPAAAGTMFGVTRFWDAIADPMMGAMADRTRTRWGRFRPYLLWMAIPFGVAGVLTFTTPHLDTGAKTVYAYCTFSFLMLAYTAINIPYSALMGVMTSDTQARTALSSLRFIGGFSGGIIVVSATPWLVARLGAGDAERGWQLTMVVWGIAASVLFVITFLTVRERVEPPPEQKADIRRELRDLLTNGP